MAASISLVEFRDTKVEGSPVLQFTSEEWEAFALGIKAGDFDEV